LTQDLQAARTAADTSSKSVSDQVRDLQVQLQAAQELVKERTRERDDARSKTDELELALKKARADLSATPKPSAPIAAPVADESALDELRAKLKESLDEQKRLEDLVAALRKGGDEASTLLQKEHEEAMRAAGMAKSDLQAMQASLAESNELVESLQLQQKYWEDDRNAWNNEREELDGERRRAIALMADKDGRIQQLSDELERMKSALKEETTNASPSPGLQPAEEEI